MLRRPHHVHSVMCGVTALTHMRGGEDLRRQVLMVISIVPAIAQGAIRTAGPTQR
jgi:hypothetical protein